MMDAAGWLEDLMDDAKDAGVDLTDAVPADWLTGVVEDEQEELDTTEDAPVQMTGWEFCQTCDAPYGRCTHWLPGFVPRQWQRFSVTRFCCGNDVCHNRPAHQEWQQTYRGVNQIGLIKLIEAHLDDMDRGLGPCMTVALCEEGTAFEQGLFFETDGLRVTIDHPYNGERMCYTSLR